MPKPKVLQLGPVPHTSHPRTLKAEAMQHVSGQPELHPAPFQEHTEKSGLKSTMFWQDFLLTTTYNIRNSLS